MISEFEQSCLYQCDFNLNALSDNFKVSGTYALINIENGKIYVGQSQNIFNRYKAHLSLLIRGVHKNKHLQSAWNLYGSTSFKFFLLKECGIENLDEEEQLLLDKVFGDNSYNISPSASTTRGMTFTRSDEYKKKKKLICSEMWNRSEYRETMLKTMSDQKYKTRASEQMRKINENPLVRERKSKESTNRWLMPKHREKYLSTVEQTRMKKTEGMSNEDKIRYLRRLERERSYAEKRRAKKKAERETLLKSQSDI